MNRQLSASTESLLSSRSRSLFANLDRDGNGFLERFELADLCGSDVSEEQFAGLFAQLDKDGDGRISLEDFREGFRVINRTLQVKHDDHQLQQQRRRSSVASSLSARLQSRSDSRDNILSELPDGCEAAGNESEAAAAAVRHRTKGKPAQQQQQQDEQLTLSLSDCLQSLACQDSVLDLYQQLSEQQQQRPQLVENFETVLAELIQTIRCLQSDQARLEASMRAERERQSTAARELEAELERQVAVAEQAALARARETAERDFRAELEAKEAELQELTRQLGEQRIRLCAADALGAEVSRLRRELEDTRSERKLAQSELIEAETRLAVAMSDISALKQALQEREFSVSREREAVQEQLRRQARISQQLQAMHVANRELRDRNEELMQVAMDTAAAAAGSPTSQRRQKRASDRATEHSDESNDPDAEEDDNEGGGETAMDACEADAEGDGIASHPAHWDQQQRRRRLEIRGLDSARVLQAANPERMFKVVLAGDSSVGKSCFIMRLCDNKFVERTTATLGVDFKTKVLNVDGRILAVQLWDTAGQERFRSIAKSYFRRADGVLLLYDCTHERSFLSVRDWVSQVREVADVPIMICGNKIDLRSEEQGESAGSRQQTQRTIGYVEARKLAQEHSALFTETSAKSGENVEQSVAELARQMWANEDLQVSQAHIKSQHQLAGSVKLSTGKAGRQTCCDS